MYLRVFCRETSKNTFLQKGVTFFYAMTVILQN